MGQEGVAVTEVSCLQGGAQSAAQKQPVLDTVEISAEGRAASTLPQEQQTDAVSEGYQAEVEGLSEYTGTELKDVLQGRDHVSGIRGRNREDTGINSARMECTAFALSMFLQQQGRKGVTISCSPAVLVEISLTNRISEADSGSLRQTERLFQPQMVHGRRILRGKFPKTRLPVHACRH